MATSLRRSTVPNDQSGPRRGGLRSKTPSMNELSKKMKNTPKGKRRLEFVEQPLKGKTFYLDLQGYKKVSSLASRVHELGGKVEEFLSKDINYLITNRKDADTRLSPRSNSTTSPGLSVPSPFPPNGNRSSSMKGAWPSPLSGDSPQSIESHQSGPKHDTRAKAIMKQAQATLTNRYGTSNILTNARTWGVCVIYLEKALEKLAEYGPSRVDKQPTIKDLMGLGKKQLRVKIRKLQVPFIKVEDQSRQYRPLVKEFKEWPFPDFDSPVGTCPFDTPRKRRDHESKKRVKGKEPKNDNKKEKTKQGYCECCCQHYDALDLHLKSDHHQSFAKDDTQYQNLDQLISQGPSLKVFLEKMNGKYSTMKDNHANSEEVSNLFQTPTKDTKKLSAKIDQNIVTPNKSIIKERGTTNPEQSREKSSQLSANPATPTVSDDGSTRRVTRSHSSPAITNSGEVNGLVVDASPIVRSKVVANTQELNKTKSNSRKQIKQKSPQTVCVPPSNSLDTKEVTKGEGILQKNELQPEIHSNSEKLIKQEHELVQNVESEEPRFTRLRSSRKSLQNNADEHKTKRVLRNRSKTNSSDSTDTLSNNDSVHPASPRKREESDRLSSSTVSLPERGSKSDPVVSPRKRCAKSNIDHVKTKHSNKKMSSTTIDTNATVAKNLKNSARKEPQVIPSPSREPIVDLIEDTSDFSDYDNISVIAEPGTPKTRGKSRWSTRSQKHKVEEPNNPKEVQNSQLDSKGSPSTAEHQTTVTNETFTSLFDSDDDDEEPFEGFDIPHFDCSRSSEQDYKFQIKKIINYFTSSQESTLVEESEDDTPVKRKKQPRGIKIIISSRTDDGDDDVFEDKNSEDDVDDVDDDDVSTIADSTDGREDEFLLSSPLRMDNLFSKRKSCNLDDFDDQQPPKRRRTTADDVEEDPPEEENINNLKDKLQSSDLNHSDHIKAEPRTTRSKSLNNNKTTNEDVSEKEVKSTTSATRKLKTTVRLESNEWKVVHDTVSKTASTNHKQTRSSSKAKDIGNVAEPTAEDFEDQLSETSSCKNTNLKSTEVDTECVPKLGESHVFSIMNQEIPPEFLEPSLVLTTIEERVKLRRIERHMKKQSEKTGNLTRASESKNRRKAQDKEINHGKEVKGRSVSAKEAKKSSVSKKTLQNDSTHDVSSRLRSRSHIQMTTPQESPPNGNNKRCSISYQKKAGQGSSPLALPNKNASWIFDPVKFTASTPRTSKKMRSKSSNSISNPTPPLTRRQLRNTSKCLIAGDSYEFTDEDEYKFNGNS